METLKNSVNALLDKENVPIWTSLLQDSEKVNTFDTSLKNILQILSDTQPVYDDSQKCTPLNDPGCVQLSSTMVQRELEKPDGSTKLKTTSGRIQAVDGSMDMKGKKRPYSMTLEAMNSNSHTC
jgi:hypothetical protein